MILLGTSCRPTSEEWIDFGEYHPFVGPVIGPTETRTFVPYSTSLCGGPDDESILNCAFPGGTATFGEILAQEEEQTKTSSVNSAGMAKALMSTWFHGKVRSFCGTYISRGVDGKPMTVSGRIMVPADGKVSRIMLSNHFTIGADKEAPSNALPMECIYAMKGIAVFEADYIGYGASADHIHPYLISDKTAEDVVDLYLAGKNFLEMNGMAPAYDDIFLHGYSQGGAVTLSVAQHIELYYPDIKIRLTMCGSGPYDICATYDTLIDNDVTDYPCAIPLIIQGMNIGENLGLDYSKFFNEKMVSNMDEWLNTKKYTMAEITSLMGSKKISSIMTPEARDKAKDLMTDLYRAMVDNSAISGWVPDCPIYLFHSIDDNVVPFVNAVNLEEKLLECNAIYNFGHYGNHVKGYLRFLFSTLDYLKANGDI